MQEPPTRLRRWGCRAATLVLAALTLPAIPSDARAEPSAHLLVLDFPDLRARAAAFRSAIADLATKSPPPLPPAATAAQLSLASRYEVRSDFYVDDLDGPVALPGTRDLIFEEEFLIGDREDDYVSAARHWLGRRLKGSDERAKRGESSRIKTKLSWDHGPIAGFGVGPLSIRGGEDHWRVQYRRSIRIAGVTWSSYVRAGETDGEFKAEFLVGRSLLSARTR